MCTKSCKLGRNVHKNVYMNEIHFLPSKNNALVVSWSRFSGLWFTLFHCKKICCCFYFHAVQIGWYFWIFGLINGCWHILFMLAPYQIYYSVLNWIIPSTGIGRSSVSLFMPPSLNFKCVFLNYNIILSDSSQGQLRFYHF